MDYNTFMEWFVYEAPLWFYLFVMAWCGILILCMGPRRTSFRPKTPTEPPKGGTPKPPPTSKHD